MSYVLLGDAVWGCVPVVAAYEIHYIAMLEPELHIEERDKDDPYRKRIIVMRGGVEIALVWCSVVGDDTSVRFLMPSTATAWARREAERFMEMATRRARDQRLMRDPAGFGRRESR